MAKMPTIYKASGVQTRAGDTFGAERGRRKRRRSTGCRRVRGGACLCNGKFAKRNRC